MEPTIYGLTVHFINDDSGRWDSQHIAFSASIDTLKQKAIDSNKNIFDEQWTTEKDESIRLETGDDYYKDFYIIKQITLI